MSSLFFQMLSPWEKWTAICSKAVMSFLMLLFATLNMPAEFEMGSSFFFPYFCARNGHCIDGRPTTRFFACFRAGEGWRVRIPVPCIHEYASGHEYASDRTSNDVTSQLTVRVGSCIRTPPTKYKSGSNRWQHGALCEQDGLRKTLPVKLAVVSADLLCVFFGEMQPDP